MITLLFATGATAQLLSGWQTSYSQWQPSFSAASTGASFVPMQSAASASAFVAQPSYSYSAMPSAASTGASITQPSFSYSAMPSAASTGASFVPMQSAASTGALVTQPSFSYSAMPSAASTGASFVPMQSAASTSAYVSQPSYAPLTSAASTGAYIQQASISSQNNPYNVKALGVGKLIGRTAQKNMGVIRQQMLGESHTVGNDLKVIENHEADKTIFTKKVVHHSPVLHKTIRTHEIAEDTVHDKLVHHMNTVKDQFRKVPGNNYMGGEQHVDHTTAIAPAPQIVAQEVAKPALMKKFSKFDVGCSCRGLSSCLC